MQRDIFDSFVGHPEGQIFLLNLLDSLECNLLPREALASYSDSLHAAAVADSRRPWLEAIAEPLGATAQPQLAGSERFVTVVPILTDDLAPAVPFDELVGDSLVPGRVVGSRVAREVFLRRQSRKYTWVTDARAVAAATAPDDLRDALGLDWVPDAAEVFVLALDDAHMRSVSPRRPTGLCKGSARFRARRDDEGSHAVYPKWGYTVDLAKWRDAAPDTRVDELAGAPELIAVIGPIDSTVATPSYLGPTQEDSGCSSDADHRRFARHLNRGEWVDADHLYARLSKFLV